MKRKGLVLNCFTGFGTLLLCLLSCATASWADARFSSGKSALAIPFELEDNLIYVRVSVNGSRPLSFILDTGAHSFIHARQARSIGLNLELIGQGRGIGAAQPDVYLVTEKVSLGLPGVAFSPRRLLAVSLDAVESCVNEFVIDEQGRNIPSDLGEQREARREVDGILGKEFFDQFVVEIDYAHRLLNVYDPSSYEYAGSGEGIPLEVGEQYVFAQAQIRAAGRAPLAGRFLLDTGSGHAVTLLKPFMDEHRLLSSTEGMTSLPVCGLGGHASEASWIGALEALHLGEFTVAAPVTEFHLSEPTTDADGFIGGAVFRRFKVIFDYSRRRMILEPRDDLQAVEQAGERRGDDIGYAEWPSTDLAEFVFTRLDLTTFRNSTGPKREPGARFFSDLGIRPTKVSADEAMHDGDWLYAVLVLERRDFNGDQVEEVAICFTDSAQNGGTYSTQKPLLLQLVGRRAIALDFEIDVELEAGECVPAQ
jgi:hypothetical protein